MNEPLDSGRPAFVVGRDLGEFDLAEFERRRPEIERLLNFAADYAHLLDRAHVHLVHRLASVGPPQLVRYTFREFEKGVWKNTESFLVRAERYVQDVGIALDSPSWRAEERPYLLALATRLGWFALADSTLKKIGKWRNFRDARWAPFRDAGGGVVFKVATRWGRVRVSREAAEELGRDADLYG